MPHYTVCGLSIAANAPIPGLRPAPARATDIAVSMLAGAPVTRVPQPGESVRYVSPEHLDDGTPLLQVWTRTDASYRLLYYEGAEFVIDRSASRIDVRWVSSLTSADAAIYLLGPVLGFAMRLRGLVPLHACAVAVDGRALLFLGDAGAGKSTTAAAFAGLGHRVLADDLVRMAETGDRLMAYPSHPRLSMWPETVVSLFGSEDALPQLTPTYQKRYLELDEDRFSDEPVPVEVIYLLRERIASRGLAIDSLTPRAALIGLVSNTYGSYLLDAGMRASEFDLLARVSTLVPVRRLAFGSGVEQLSESCRRLAGKRPMETAVQPV